MSATRETDESLRIFWLDGRMLASDRLKKGAMALRTGVLERGAVGEQVIDARVCECCGTDAAVTAKGPIIVYRDRDETEVRDISIIRRLGDQFTPPAAVHRDGWKIEGCPVNGPAVDAHEERVAVAYFTGAGGPKTMVAFSADSGATFQPPVRLDGGGESLGRVDVVVDDKGGAIVSWLETIEGERAAVRLRRVHASGRVGEPVTVLETSGARASGFPRIVRHQGSLMVGWTEVAETTRVRVRAIDENAIPAATRLPQIATAARAADQPFRYRAETLDGKRASIADFKRPVLLNVFATWCEPCREELPELLRIHTLYKAKLAIVGVSVDDRTATNVVMTL